MSHNIKLGLLMAVVCFLGLYAGFMLYKGMSNQIVDGRTNNQAGFGASSLETGTLTEVARWQSDVTGVRVECVLLQDEHGERYLATVRR